MMRRLRPLGAAAVCVGLSACAVGPNYRRPSAPPAAMFKEERGWVPATPARIVPSAWWSIYHDPVLAHLERRVDVSNQTLKAAVAAYYAARAAAGVTRGSLFPSIDLGAAQTRSGGGAATQFTFGGARTANEVGASGSWDVDLWGELRRELESANAQAQASAADVAAARLSAQTTLAADYFQLRAAEQQLRLLKIAVKDDRLSLRIAENRVAAGVTTLADVYSARTTLESTRSQEQSAELTRANLEHAVAVLIGEPPSQLTLAYGHLAAQVPVVPAGVPSQLLLRNPAVAAAERAVASANAQIGVAEAAWFPSLTLSGSYDFDSAALSSLIRASNAVWSFGPSLAENLFNGGATLARIREARATYDETVADYRQTVLGAFEQVENDLATLRYLQVEYAEEFQAVQDAKRAEVLTLNQYKAGTADYATLLSAQTAELTAEVTLVGLQSERLVASVDLIDAVGGGWNSAELDHANDGVHATLRSTVAVARP
jgi:NodT family efflux transporter outer membrane factor (OMF) lipoprotein